jgi:hypothetical protein
MSNFIADLDRSKPTEFDPVADGASEIRGIKDSLRDTFPFANTALTVSNEAIVEAVEAIQSGQAGGIVASCKYNGSSIKYSSNISSVTPVGNNGYRVNFISDIDEFDDHYAVSITPFVSQSGLPTLVTLTGFNSSWVEFTMTEITNGGQQAPSAPVGFSLLIVDMVQG